MFLKLIKYRDVYIPEKNIQEYQDYSIFLVLDFFFIVSPILCMTSQQFRAFLDFLFCYFTDLLDAFYLDRTWDSCWTTPSYITGRRKMSMCLGRKTGSLEKVALLFTLLLCCINNCCQKWAVRWRLVNVCEREPHSNQLESKILD